MAKSLYARVRKRAGGRCEYCRMPRIFDVLPFQIDHIIARKHRGLTVFNNLALTCFACNSHKGPDVGGMSPASGKFVRLFNPRKDRWSNHFQWREAKLLGKTAVGIVTILVLEINDPFRIATRGELMLGGNW